MMPLFRKAALAGGLSFFTLSASCRVPARQAQKAHGHAGRADPGQEGFQGRAALLRAAGNAGLLGQHVRRSQGPAHHLRPVRQALPHHAAGRSAASPSRPRSRSCPSTWAKRRAWCGRSTACMSSSIEGKKYPQRPVARHVPPRTTMCSTARNCCVPSTGPANMGRTRCCRGPMANRSTSLHGNHTKLIDLADSLCAARSGARISSCRVCGTPRGHAVGIMAPAGCIYKTDKDGKDWTLVSMGYRNQYDAAFNRDGELFTFDADMEWDMNTALVSADARLPCGARQRVRLARRHRQDVRILSRQSAAGRQRRARQPDRHLLRLRGQVPGQVSGRPVPVRLELRQALCLSSDAGRRDLQGRTGRFPGRLAVAAHRHRHQSEGRRHVFHHRRPQHHVGACIASPMWARNRPSEPARKAMAT